MHVTALAPPSASRCSVTPSGSPSGARSLRVARVGLEPTSRAHEAREEAAPLPRDEQVWPAGVEPAISGAQNRRGGHLPYSQAVSSQCGIRSRGSRTRKPLKAPASRSLPQPLTGHWFPGRGPGGVREVDDRGIEPRSTAVSERRFAQPARRRCLLRRSEILARAATCAIHGAPPGNRTLLHGFTARGLATSLATQSRREESNPHRPR